MAESSARKSDIFDLSLLPPARYQFVVMSDTHYLLPDNAQAQEWQSIAEFPHRTERALELAGSLSSDFQVHLGDVSHEYPETGRAEKARDAAKEQFERFGLAFFHAAGNMDIGDKPDPTSPANWVSPETLNAWHTTFGPSWQSFDFKELHGIVLNTQIMNGPLPAATAQQRWAEEDLAANADRRLLLFLHMPIYFVDPDEAALGFYNSLDEPARGWLLDLIEDYQIELVFAGHTHFVSLNRYGDTRLYVVPSTATSRAGLAEAYTSLLPDKGRSDIDKLGFYFVRLDDRGSSVHFIRTGRESKALHEDDPRKIVVTRTSGDLPNGRVGLFASHPLGHTTPGPVIWPSIVRQPVRDDWRSLSCLELGANRIRVPVSDLDTCSESDRLAFLREEGVAICPYWVWSDRLDFAAEVESRQDQLDLAEIVLPGTTAAPETLLTSIRDVQQHGIAVTLSTAMQHVTGKYHARTRVGYLSEELDNLNRRLVDKDLVIENVACRVYPDESLWEMVMAASNSQGNQIGSLDFYLDFESEDDGANADVMAEAMLAVTVADGRLMVGPMIDLDRSMDVAHGLLDRFSNPRPVFNVARGLNSILGIRSDAYELDVIRGSESHREITVRCRDERFRLLLNRNAGQLERLEVARETRSLILYELTSCLSTQLDSHASEFEASLAAAIARSSGPLLIVELPSGS